LKEEKAANEVDKISNQISEMGFNYFIILIIALALSSIFDNIIASIIIFVSFFLLLFIGIVVRNIVILLKRAQGIN